MKLIDAAAERLEEVNTLLDLLNTGVGIATAKEILLLRVEDLKLSDSIATHNQLN